ncbi:MAG: LysR family transcriptional regulator [Alphaproteobacteria bacterium]|nr:LysR family transcriptional regulator [Alphaproteobacteria bacterium]
MIKPSFTGSLGDTDIRLLRVFATVVECGGFTPAEAELDIARSTISTHIANLETRLGLRLCERGRGGFALTEEGRLVYQEAQRLMGAVAAFEARVSGAGNRLVGDLHVAVIDGILTLPDVPIAETLARFRDAAPDVHVTLSVMSSEEMERRVLDGTLHAAFIGQHRKRSGLTYREIAREVQYIYCGRGHPLFVRPDADITERDLTDHPYVGLSLLDTAHSTDRPYRTRPAASASNLEAILILLQTGRYLGRLPEQYTHTWEASGILRPLRKDLTRYEQGFALITRDTKRPSPVLAAFLDAVG